MSKRIIGALLSCAMILSCVGCSSSSSSSSNSSSKSEQQEYYESASSYGIDFSDVEISNEVLASSGQNFYIDDNLFILEETTYQDFINMNIEVPEYCAEFDSDTVESNHSFAVEIHTYIKDDYYFSSQGEGDRVELFFSNETEESISRNDCVLTSIWAYYYSDVGLNRCSFEFNSNISKSDLVVDDNGWCSYEANIEGKDVTVEYRFDFEPDWKDVRYILYVSSEVIPSNLSYDYSSIEVPFDVNNLDYFNQPFYIYGDKFICGVSTLQDFIDAGYLEDCYSDEVISPDDHVYTCINEKGVNFVELLFRNFTETDLSAYDCILYYVYLNLEDDGDTTVFSLGFPCNITTSDMLSDAVSSDPDVYYYSQQMSYSDKSITGRYEFWFDDENNLSSVGYLWRSEYSQEVTAEYYYEEAEYDDSWTFNSDSVDFQNMVFYYKGNKVILGETTLNEFLALGVECTQDIDPTYIVGKHLVGTYKFRLSESKTMTIQATNFTSDDLEFGDCVISGVAIKFDETDNIMQRQSYNALSFDFPMNITEEQVLEVEYDKGGRESRHSYEDEEDITYYFDYLSKDKSGESEYTFAFDLEGNIIAIGLTWYPGCS